MYLYVSFCSLLLVRAIDVQEVSKDTLVLVHAFVRHGERTPDPVSAFPTDVYKNFSYFPYGYGELNQKGIRNAYQVGKDLRKRYNKFLGPKFYPQILEASSSGYSRCKMTMQLVLAGLFPPDPTQTFQEGLAWQPIAYEYTDVETDTMLSFKVCIKTLLNIKFNEKFNTCKDRNYMIKYLSEKSGNHVESPMSMLFIYDTIRSELENGLNIPGWAEPIFPEPLCTCGHDFWRHFVAQKSVLGAIGGLFLKKVFDDTKKMIELNSTLQEKKLFLYNGHETTVYMILGALDSYNNVAVSYLAYVLFEVHKIDGIYGFKKGIRNAFQVGKDLRKRYNKFLGPKYYPHMLDALSSGLTRCKMSMQVVLAGLFPPDPSQSFQEGLAWQPIAYQYTDAETDIILAPKFCKNYLSRIEFNAKFSACKDRSFMIKYLTEKCGNTVESPMSVFLTFDGLRSELENGLNLPGWAEPIWPEPLLTCAHDFWRHFVGQKSALGATGGLFLKKLFDDTKKMIEINSTFEEKKLFLYSGHEGTMYMLLGVLEIYNNIVLNYLAYMLFEVHKIDGVYGFKIYWDNRDEMGLRQVEILTCGTFCPVDSFYELMKFYINSEPCPP